MNNHVLLPFIYSHGLNEKNRDCYFLTDVFFDSFLESYHYFFQPRFRRSSECVKLKLINTTAPSPHGAEYITAKLPTCAKVVYVCSGQNTPRNNRFNVQTSQRLLCIVIHDIFYCGSARLSLNSTYRWFHAERS